MENIQQNMLMVDADGESVRDDMGQIVPGTVVTLHDNIISALRSAFPVWADYWKITIDTRGGIVQVRNLMVSGDFGFALHITKVDPEMRRVRDLAGELFERFNISRSRNISIEDAMRDVKSNGIGKLKHEN
tara:strand:- start:311 stop:703 length:393 start_codon:yes stop_codon:yes gene_type:complete